MIELNALQASMRPLQLTERAIIVGWVETLDDDDEAVAAAPPPPPPPPNTFGAMTANDQGLPLRPLGMRHMMPPKAAASSAAPAPPHTGATPVPGGYFDDSDMSSYYSLEEEDGEAASLDSPASPASPTLGDAPAPSAGAPPSAS